MDGLDR